MNPSEFSYLKAIGDSLYRNHNENTRKMMRKEIQYLVEKI